MTDKNIKIAELLDAKIGGKPERGSVLISAGAGGDMDSSLLEKTSVGLQKLGFQTLRWNYGYVAKNGVASGGGKREINEMLSAIDYLKERAKNSPIILLGKSFGARLSTYVGATRTDIAGYAFYGLPIRGLSPKSKPRDWSHLSQLGGPVVFVTGDKDRLCPINELPEVQQHVKTKCSSFTVPGDHSYKPRGEDEALKVMLEWFDKTF